MKKILSMAVAVLLACTAFAEDYNRITLAYQGLDFSISNRTPSVGRDGALDGFKLGYTHGFGLSSKAPVFLEVGADVSFNISDADVTILSTSLEGVKYNRRVNTCGITIPVSLGYKFSFKNKMWLEPYAGACFKFNIMGKTKYDYADNSGIKDADMNWFKEADMSIEDEFGPDKMMLNYMGGSACKRAQFGGQFGVNLGYKHVNLNVGYQIHSQLQKSATVKVNTNALTVGIGYTF